MSKIKIALLPILILLFFQCAGFYNKPEKLENTVQKNFSTSVRIEFTGFGFYEKELNLLKAEILKSGFKENNNSPLLLEILLEEKEVTYNYKFLHVLNMVTSIFSASLIPYYTITQHKITYRFSENNKSLGSYSLILKLDQLRGLSVLPLTYFFWPSSAFDQSILDSWSKGELVQ